MRVLLYDADMDLSGRGVDCLRAELVNDGVHSDDTRVVAVEQDTMKPLKCTSLLKTWPLVTGIRLTGCGSCLFLRGNCGLQTFTSVRDSRHLFMVGRSFVDPEFGGSNNIFLQLVRLQGQCAGEPLCRHMEPPANASCAPSGLLEHVQQARVALKSTPTPKHASNTCPNHNNVYVLKIIRSPGHPCPNHNSVRVPKT